MSPRAARLRVGLLNAEVFCRAALARARPWTHPGGTVDVFLCLVDHFEPQVKGSLGGSPRERVDDWLRRYPAIARRFADAEGRHPAHSFFYPWDEYDAWELERIAELCARGFGEIELHLHHRRDTTETLRGKLREALRVYRRHGALSSWRGGRPAFGFIHGDWALDNSRLDPDGDRCGVNDELTLLRAEGCYADFTFPAWKEQPQPRTINRVYYAVDDPRAPRSHDRGIRARAGAPHPPEGLMLVEGPLVPYRGRRAGLPWLRMDDADLAHYRRYAPERFDRWLGAGVTVEGRPDRLFVKLHTHGAEDRNRAALLGADLEALFADAESRFNDGKRFRLHHVTARELFNVIRATEEEVEGPIAALRDHVLPPPGWAGTS